MKKNKSINELEFDLLNEKQKPTKTWQLYIYNIIKFLLIIIYIATCIICTIIELFVYMLSFGSIAINFHRNKKRR